MPLIGDKKQVGHKALILATDKKGNLIRIEDQTHNIP